MEFGAGLQIIRHNIMFGVSKTLGLIFRSQQRNSGMDFTVLKVREYSLGFDLKAIEFYLLQSPSTGFLLSYCHVNYLQ